MSNIPAARKLLKAALESHRTKSQMRALITHALFRMTREKAVTHARKKPIKITQYMRRMVRVYAAQGKSQAVIARKVGLANAGRVSEILHGKR
jgi:hypothetical protein